MLNGSVETKEDVDRWQSQGQLSDQGRSKKFKPINIIKVYSFERFYLRVVKPRLTSLLCSM